MIALKKWAYPAALLTISFYLTGCGTYVPEIAEPWDGPDGTRELEFNIKKAVFCEIRDAVRSVNIKETLNGRPVEYLPGDWGAQVTLSLQVDETSAVNPGASAVNPMPNYLLRFPVGGTVTAAQSFALGGGATVSSQSSRTDKFNMYYLVSDLRMPIDVQNDICTKSPPGYSFFLLSDLGIKKWLKDALEVDRRLPSSVPPVSATSLTGGGATAEGGTKSSAGGLNPKPDTISYEVKFVLVSSGNITPTWKLVRFSANTGSVPFLGAGRTRTHNLIITLGPSSGPGAEQANLLNLAAQIGQANASSLRPLLTPSVTPLPFVSP